VTNRIPIIGQSCKSEARSYELLARLLSRLARATPSITIEPVDKNGDLAFFVRLADLKITRSDFKRVAFCKTTMLADTMAELLIWKNLPKFTDIVAGLPTAEYEASLLRFDHRNAGLGLTPDSLRLSIHMSLVADIMNEELRLLLGENLR
jgi:hypothetical protein